MKIARTMCCIRLHNMQCTARSRAQAFVRDFDFICESEALSHSLSFLRLSVWINWLLVLVHVAATAATSVVIASRRKIWGRGGGHDSRTSAFFHSIAPWSDSISSILPCGNTEFASNFVSIRHRLHWVCSNDFSSISRIAKNRNEGKKCQ